MIIDWEHHIGTEESYRNHKGKDGQLIWMTDETGRARNLIREEMYRVDKHIEFMDAAGIDVAVLSTLLYESKISAKLMAKMIIDYPGRFIGLAPIMPLRGKEALDEMEWAVKDLGLKGVCLNSAVKEKGVFLDSNRYWPFYQKASELDVPIYVDVGEPAGYDAIYSAPYSLAHAIVREYDQAVTTIRLVLSGVLTEFPDLKIVISHFGGGISAIKERLIRYIRVWDDKFWSTDQNFWSGIGIGHPISKPYVESFERDFNKIYFDMAGYEGGMNAVKCALTTISPYKLLFGTDYYSNFSGSPAGSKSAKDVRKYIEDIKELNLPQAAIDGMLGENAIKLLGINVT